MNANQTRAARALKTLLINRASAVDNGIVIREGDQCMQVIWCDGPFEWAPRLTGGSDLDGQWSDESPWYPEVQSLEQSFGVRFECANECTINIYVD